MTESVSDRDATEVLQTHLRYAHCAAAEALNEAMLFDWESVGSAEWELSRFSVLAHIIELHEEVEELKGLVEWRG